MALFFFLRRRRKKATRPMIPMAATPPTVPPTIAPTGVLEPPPLSSSEFDVVAEAAVSDVVSDETGEVDVEVEESDSVVLALGSFSRRMLEPALAEHWRKVNVSEAASPVLKTQEKHAGAEVSLLRMC